MSQGSPVHSAGLSRTEDLAWAAATLAERVAHAGTSSGRRAAAAEDALEAWARAVAIGDRAALGRRLAWDGIDEATARAALASRPPPDPIPAAWLVWVPRFLDEAMEVATTVGPDGGDLDGAAREPPSEPPSEPPFAEAWIPLLGAARRVLAGACGPSAALLSDAARLALERALVRQFAAVGALALVEDFGHWCEASAPDTSASRYGAFVRGLLAGGWWRIFSGYPVLARQLATLAGDWVEGTTEFVRRLEHDQHDIEATFGIRPGRVAELAPGLSDRHAGGRAVARVTFEAGGRLAYKPREVRLEAAFNRFLAWLADAGLRAAPRSLRVLDRGDYGWVEWVEQSEFSGRESAAAYFAKAGSLACLVHVLGGADLHGENVVASAGGPVLVDTEMLLQPIVGRPRPGEAGEATAHAPEASCLAPGFVSLLQVDAAGRPFDVGGLQPSPTRTASIPQRRWRDLRSDTIRVEAHATVTPVLSNDVRVGGAVEPPGRHADAMCSGFEETYRFLMARRADVLAPDGPLALMDGCPTRVLFRPSDQYGALQLVLATPRYQRSGVERSLAIETLGRVFSRETDRPLLWPLMAQERLAIEHLDIPRLVVSASSTTIVAADGQPVDGFLALSGCAAARARVAALADADLDYQVDQLRTALMPAGPTRPRRAGGDEAPPGRTAADTDAALLVAAAEEIGDLVLSLARQGPGGTLVWPACRGRVDLYAGSGGLLLFLSALAARRGGDRWRDAAAAVRASISTAAPRDLSPGSAPRDGCGGPASLVYVLPLAARLLGDGSESDAALESVSVLRPAAFDRDIVLDVEGGVAGTLLALLAAHECTGLGVFLEMAGGCARRLLATQLADGPDRGAWPAGADARPRAGFAHGAAGIAYALSRWFEHDAASAVHAAVRRAWQYERAVFRRSGSVWPTVRGDGSHVVMAAWCHGAPGIGLARACGRRYLSDDEVSSEIEAAVSATLSAPRSRLDHLCCGNMSRAEALLTVGLALGDAAIAARGAAIARSVAEQVVAHGRHGCRGQGFERGAATPGFFQGLSGIGYQLLRSSAPGALPSVAAFQAPGGRGR